MPGISLVFNNDKNVSLTDLKHTPDYQIDKLIDEDGMLAFFSGYEGYPRRLFKQGGTTVFVEGVIYNRSERDIEASLMAIAASTNNTLIKEFVNTSDGEFIVLIYSQGRITIFNDRWGRLPAYYFHSGNTFIFSREVKFILPFVPTIVFDRFAVAEFLLFEFVLGEKTLMKGITRVMPASIINMDGNLQLVTLFPLNFEDAKEPISKEKCIDNCRNLLVRSVNDRLSKMQEMGYNITADLSGGFDTRAVFGALCQSGTQVEYYTENLATGDESDYARKIAQLYGQKVKYVDASHKIDISDMAEVVYRTDCMVNANTAVNCYRDEMERLKQSPRKSIRFAGLGGGEFIKRIPKAKPGYKNLAQMMTAGHLVSVGSVEKVCGVLGIDSRLFVEHLTAYFNQYPESTLSGKVRHWHFEYEYKLVSSGEDRGRALIWPVEPLWSQDFFSFVTMHIPEKYIDGTAFYFEFLKAIDPKLLDVPIFSTIVYRDSRLDRRKRYLIGALRDILVMTSLTRGFLRRYRDRNLDGDAERERISREIMALNLAFCNSAHLDRTALYRLLGLSLYVKEIEKRFGRITKYEIA